MNQGVHLTLLAGPLVPLPVPKAVLDSLTSVEVTNNVDGPSVFQLSFTLDKNSILQTIFLLAGGGSIPPIFRVILIVTINGMPETLIDGVMTNHEVTGGSDKEDPQLTITGEDLTKVMSYLPFDGVPYPAMPPEARVGLILLKYAVFGIIPLIIPSVLLDFPNPLEIIPRHKGTDLSYVKALADKVGYTFYVEPGPVPGTNVGYWGPEVRVGDPQPALNTNMDMFTNVESLSFSFNAENKKIPILFIQEPNTKVPIPIPIPDVSPLSPPLGFLEPLPKGFEPLDNTANLKPWQAAIIGLAKASKAADVATAKGSLDVFVYGRVLKARRLVGVRGAGLAFDGLYFVKQVTHSIKRGSYKQTFSLVRNGLISTVPRVPA